MADEMNKKGYLSLRKNIIMCKAPIQSAQNDALEATLSHSTQEQRSEVRIEKFKVQRKEILMRSVLNLCHNLLSLSF